MIMMLLMIMIMIVMMMLMIIIMSMIMLSLLLPGSILLSFGPQIEDISADYKQYFSEPMGYIHLGVVVLCAYVIVCLDRKIGCQQKWLEDKTWLTQ